LLAFAAHRPSTIGSAWHPISQTQSTKITISVLKINGMPQIILFPSLFGEKMHSVLEKGAYRPYN
jgi:hypothetical protein